MSSENKYVSRKVDGVRKNSLIEEGASHYRAKRYEEALSAYKRAIQFNSDNAAAYVGKGDSFLKLKSYEEALYAYEKAIKLDPNNASAYNGVCYAFSHLGYSYDEALRAHEKAIQLNPRSAAA